MQKRWQVLHVSLIGEKHYVQFWETQDFYCYTLKLRFSQKNRHAGFHHITVDFCLQSLWLYKECDQRFNFVQHINSSLTNCIWIHGLSCVSVCSLSGMSNSIVTTEWDWQAKTIHGQCHLSLEPAKPPSLSGTTLNYHGQSMSQSTHFHTPILKASKL